MNDESFNLLKPFTDFSMNGFFVFRKENFYHKSKCFRRFEESFNLLKQKIQENFFEKKNLRPKTILNIPLEG
jgi:hypothetical protein